MIDVMLPLSQAIAEEQPRAHGFRRAIPFSEEGPGEWAKVRFRGCVDDQGYHRRKHEYLVCCRRGTICLWCGRVRGMERI